MTNQMRVEAVYAADILNDFVGDFVSGVMPFHEWEATFDAQHVTEETKVAVQKICLFHLVLGLSKFEEFYRSFHRVIPSEHRDACKGLLRQIQRKGVIDFRNTCVGHIWDKLLDRPLVHSENHGAV